MKDEKARKTVGDLMITDVVTISPLATVREALQKMKARRVKSLVVDKQSPGDAYGILTYTHILRTIVAEEGDIDLINVYDVCTKPVISVPRQLEVRHAITLMLQLGIKRIVVTSDNELEGILTMNEIVGVVIELAGDNEE